VTASGESSSYVLGSHERERDRLQRQHAIWRDDCISAWQQAGWGAGQRLLDLGCGPGFASLDLAERVGPTGRVLAIDNASAYLEHLQAQASQGNLQQLHTLALDLNQASGVEDAFEAPAAHGLVEGQWDGAWCRWVAMFLKDLNPLLDLIARALRPGGTLILHEYGQWDTFALYPRGAALDRFVCHCIQHWRDHGGDPHVAQRLPALLEARGLRLKHCRSLMACSPSDAPKAQWLQDFLGSYPAQLAAAGLWSPGDQEELDADLSHAMGHSSVWVTPALMEMVWEKPCITSKP